MLSTLAAYALVTPIGIAIGIGVRNTFQANDPSTILTIGILNSLSAGVLLYGALVNLIAKDFLAGQMLEVSNARLGVALISMFVGAALMSLRKSCLSFSRYERTKHADKRSSVAAQSDSGPNCNFSKLMGRSMPICIVFDFLLERVRRKPVESDVSTSVSVLCIPGRVESSAWLVEVMRIVSIMDILETA